MIIRSCDLRKIKGSAGLYLKVLPVRQDFFYIHSTILCSIGRAGMPY